MGTVGKKQYEYDINNFASYIDFASHRANITEPEIEELCKKALEYPFHSVFVNPCYVQQVKKIVNTKRKVGTVVSFPLGQETFAMKIAATKQCLLEEADEFDISLNVAFIKEHRWQNCYKEMETLVKTVKDFDERKLIKFIPETGYLNADEIKKVSELMAKSGADFFKTCSGYGPRGATLEDVALIRDTVGDAIKIKVAGGITTYRQVLDFIRAGAKRIGTSSAAEIIKSFAKTAEK